MPEYSNQTLGLDDFLCNVQCEELYEERPDMRELLPDPAERRMAGHFLRTVDAVAFACGLPVSLPDKNTARPF